MGRPDAVHRRRAAAGRGPDRATTQWEVQRELTERLKNTLDATDLGDNAEGAAGPDGAGSLASAPGAPTAETAGKASHPGHVT